MNHSKETLLINRHFGDLNPILYGSEECTPGHTYGPAVRKYTLIHYVLSGCGTYTENGRTHTVKPGEAFRILPGEVTVYSADRSDPWEYRWIGFDGTLSERFSEIPPVFSVPKHALGAFFLEAEDSGNREFLLAAELFRLYAALFSGESGRHSQYVRRVKDYVHAMYMQEVRVERIAAQMNLDRRYLSRIFKEKTGKSIQEYLISVRIEEAKRCLSRGLTVSEAAILSGYEDVCNFSKMFKSRVGVSPSSYAAKNSNERENFLEMSKKV